MVFEDLDNWRARFLNLQRDHEVLELSDKAGLPRWLSGSGVDFWERGNRWVIQMAVTSGASRITLVALWDGKMKGDSPGGTAHMVQLATNTGVVRVVIVDAKRLIQ